MPSMYSRPEESIGLALRKTRENLAFPQDLLRAGWQASESTLHNHHAASFQSLTTPSELRRVPGSDSQLILSVPSGPRCHYLPAK